MKEATGETNMTIITIVLIAAVLVIARPLITGITKAIEGEWENQTNVDVDVDYEEN